MENKKADYIEDLNKFLLRNGINVRKPKVSFSSMKVPGGTQYDPSGKAIKFMGVILYMVNSEEISVVVVPYANERRAFKKTRRHGDDDRATFQHECREEAGFVPDYADAWVAYEHTAVPGNDDLSVVFLACKITLEQAKLLRKDFIKYNPDDPDKGLPFLVPIQYVWKFLSDTHLSGARGFLQKIRSKHLLGHTRNISENFIRYLQGIISPMITEERRREGLRIEKIENKV